MKRALFLLISFCFITEFYLGQENVNCGTEVSESDKYVIQQFIRELKENNYSKTPFDSVVPIQLRGPIGITKNIRPSLAKKDSTRSLSVMLLTIR